MKATNSALSDRLDNMYRRYGHLLYSKDGKGVDARHQNRMPKFVNVFSSSALCIGSVYVIALKNKKT